MSIKVSHIFKIIIGTFSSTNYALKQLFVETDYQESSEIVNRNILINLPRTILEGRCAF